MIWFLIIAGLLTVAALAILLRPIIRQPPPGAEQEEPVAALFRRQFAAIDEELTEGRLSLEEADGARAETTRRLLAAADREPAGSVAPAGRAPEMSWRFGAAIAIAGMLPAMAMAVYFAVGAPAAIDHTAIDRNAAAPEAAAPHGAAELAAAADRIKAHLDKVPGDLEGWTLLGRTLASLSRFPEAREAYAHAIAMAPGDAQLHAEFGEVLVLAAQGKVTPAAEAEFAKAPDDPRARFYGAEAALQHGDAAAARQKLQALLADAPADAAWRQAVADRLAELSPNRQAGNADAPASPRPSGPSAQDVAAAQALAPEQRQAMIRGMVERLAQRLEQHPDDKAGWARLARAYDVLGEPGKAQAARARAAAAEAPSAGPPTTPANAAGWLKLARSYQGLGRSADALAALKQGNAQFVGNLPLLEAYMSALAGGIKDDRLSPEFVDLATQVNALDAKEPDALWYLGLAAAQSGDRYRAGAYWDKLVAELPQGDSRRAMVQHRLDALR